MSSSAIQISPQHELVRSADAIIAQRDAIVDCMRRAMKEGIDYGTIPGTPKPTLYKPGSEKLLSMFHMAAEPIVEDLSTPDCMRFRVTIRVTEMGSGRYLGSGIGEASSAEAKYQWRAAVCEPEFEETPVDRRRMKWKKADKNHPLPYSVQQVRADMEDVANTVLKMAKKRAQIDAVLTFTAASDVFSQDLEDLPPGMDPAEAGGEPVVAQHSTLQRKADAPAATQDHATGGAPTINEAQSRRFYALMMKAEKENRLTKAEVKEWLQREFGSSDDRKIPTAEYERACDFVEGK